MTKSTILGCLALLFSSQSISAQTVLSVELQEEISIALLEIILPIISPDHPVNTYKVIYTGHDAFGQPDTLSGLLGIPQTTDNPQFPILVYHHGTSSSKTDVPSTLGTGERGLVNAFTTKSYITLAPDYLGLGVDSLELHPYVHEASEAQASKDMLLAVRDWLTTEGIAYNDQIFVTGYSQGGHAGAAFHRLLEEENDPDLQVTAASHLSGPYEISGAMRETILDTEFTTVPGYLIYTYVSYNFVYGLSDDNGTIFVQPYLTPIDSFSRGEISLGELNDHLFDLLATNDADLPDLFQDSVITILTENDPSHPMIQALRDNDLHDWAPQAPTRLVYCTLDEQVPFQNALRADSLMNFLGAPDVESANGGERDHRGCVIPAALFTLDFFNGYANVLSAVEHLSQLEPTWQLSPNPVLPGQILRLASSEDQPTHYALFDLQGREVSAGLIPELGQIHLPDLTAGSYIIRLYQNDRLAVRKLIVR